MFYLVPIEKYCPIRLEQLAHFCYMTILLLYKKHTTIIRWIPIPPTTHKPNLWYYIQRLRYLKNSELALFLLTRLTLTQNSFIILISIIRCIFFTLVFCSKNLCFSHNFIEKPNVHSLNKFCIYDHFVIVLLSFGYH